MSGLEADLAFAHLLADAAEPIALRHFTEGTTAWRAKYDGSPVSEADERIEHALRTQVRRHRSHDALLGEELGADGHSPRRWIIDAVDGTASFLAGEPEWSTLIALEERGTAQLGVVAAPALQRRWWAARSTGAWTRSTDADSRAEPLTITGASHLRDATVGIWPPPPRLSPSDTALAVRIAAAAGHTRPVTDWTGVTRPPGLIRKPSTGTGCCHGALLVATGHLDAFLLLGAGPWDIAALIPIVEEAGGTYTDLFTSGETRSGLFASNPALHQQLLDLTIHTY